MDRAGSDIAWIITALAVICVLGGVGVGLFISTL